MPIFISPDRTQYPASLDAIICAGLEELTGADMCVSRFPMLPTLALERHIQQRTLFVQVKIGYDAIGDFSQVDREIARFQACKIPMQQAFILCCGQYYPNEEGLLRIKGVKPLENNKSIKYETFLKLEAEWRYSGMQVQRLNDIEELPTWISAQLGELERIEARGKKEIYPKGEPFVPEQADIWQPVVEVSHHDPRYVLCAGLKGFGPKRAQAVLDYIATELPHLGIRFDGVDSEFRTTLYHFLKVLTEADAKGKPVHKISGIGQEGFRELRQLVGLRDGFNLSATNDVDHNGAGYMRGWYGALKCLKELIEEIDETTGKPKYTVKNVFNGLMKQADEFFKGD